MHNQLILNINGYGVLHEYQFGFQKGKSTTALISLTDKISEALDQSELVIGIFLSLSTLWVILPKELELYSVQEIVLNLFDYYLINYLQYVTYNNVKSDKENVKCGVL